MSNPHALWISTGTAKRQPYHHAKKTASSTITVPVPDHKEIKIGTLQSIIRQSGISKEHFEH
jgi:hypothetical protein